MKRTRGRPRGPVSEDVNPAVVKFATAFQENTPREVKNAEIAHATSRSEAMISRYMRGESVPQWDVMQEIVGFLRRKSKDEDDSRPFPTDGEWYELHRAAAEEAGTKSECRLPGSPKMSAAESAVKDMSSMLYSGRDFRTRSSDDRQLFLTLGTQVPVLLDSQPPGGFRGERRDEFLQETAAAAEAMTSNREASAALDLTTSVLGRDFCRGPGRLGVLREQARALSELRRYPEAKSALDDLMAIEKRRMPGLPDPESLMLWGWVLGALERRTDAWNVLHSLEKSLKRSGGCYRLPLHVGCRKGYVTGKLGYIDDSKNAYADVIDSRTCKLGKDHPDTLDAQHSLGKILAISNRPSEALAVLEDLPERRARVQGDNHLDVLESRKYRSWAAAKIERRNDGVIDDAIRDLQEILRILKERYFLSDPLILDVKQKLGYLFNLRDGKY